MPGDKSIAIPPGYFSFWLVFNKTGVIQFPKGRGQEHGCSDSVLISPYIDFT